MPPTGIPFSYHEIQNNLCALFPDVLVDYHSHQMYHGTKSTLVYPRQLMGAPNGIFSCPFYLSIY